MIVTVNVTQDHIVSGLRQNCYHCPVAIAMEVSTGQEWSVYVIGARRLCDSVFLDLPDAVRIFASNFDKGHSVAPFSFDINIPEVTK